MSIKNEVDRRRTFAIISHPDAGKTTITEQLLLYSGAIRQAGTVKGKKSGQFAKSDWMEIEKQRGISVTSSVLEVEFDGFKINIVDTPGHEDFSEDTYRTLMAVDSAVMVIDSSRGIEPQTKKLFKVCRMRGIPIFTFMNKLDRDGREPLDLLQELEDILGIDGCPMNWPIGMGKNLAGLVALPEEEIELNPDHYTEGRISLAEAAHHPVANSLFYEDAMLNVELVQEAGVPFDREKVAAGELTPVFFGSALTGFGVEAFLKAFVDFAPAPTVQETVDGQAIAPDNEDFSGFIFKIQANMDPRHRDRIAFLRLCSGSFHEGLEVKLARTGKPLRLNNTTRFVADDREKVAAAVAGDIIGLYDTGNFQIGDSLYTGKDTIEYPPLPQFTPELFMQVAPKNVMKQKSFHKGMQQLVQEGAIQLFRTWFTGEYIIGAVGQLQFEVFEHRLLKEYHAEVNMTPLGKKTARWVDPDELNTDWSSKRNLLCKDRFAQPVFLFENDFALRWFQEHHPDVQLTSLI